MAHFYINKLLLNDFFGIKRFSLYYVKNIRIYMVSKIKVILVIFVFVNSSLYAKDKKIQIGYEFQYGHSFLKSYSFDDDQDVNKNNNIADKWLGEINSGNNFTLQMVLELPFGFLPYLGYYQGNFKEEKNDQDLWDERYRFSFSDIVPDISYTSNIITGYSYGLKYRLEFFDLPIVPFISGEILNQQFKSINYLKSKDLIYTGNVEIPEDIDITIFAHSIMETKKIKEKVFGYGLEYDIGDFTIIGTAKFYRISSPVQTRYKNKFYHLSDNYPDGVSGWMTIPDNHSIDFDRNEISLGLRYNIPAIIEEKETKQSRKFSGLSIEVITGLLVPEQNSFTKKTPTIDAKEYSNPYKLIDQGLGLNFNVIYNNSKFVQPYIGFNYSKYSYEKKMVETDIKTLTSSFSGISTNNVGEVTKYDFRYINKGLHAGTYINLASAKNKVVPFVVCEVLLNKFSFFSKLESNLQNLDPDINLGDSHGLYKGSIKKNTEYKFGYGLGTGFKYRLGRFNIKPIMKYSRLLNSNPFYESEYMITNPESMEIIKDDDFEFNLNKMKIRYFNFSIGIEYDL